jgi:hypothetical protein
MFELGLAVQYITLPAGNFTMFAPTEKAAVKLATLLASEGCSKLPIEKIQEVSSVMNDRFQSIVT